MTKRPIKRPPKRNVGLSQQLLVARDGVRATKFNGWATALAAVATLTTCHGQQSASDDITDRKTSAGIEQASAFEPYFDDDLPGPEGGPDESVTELATPSSSSLTEYSIETAHPLRRPTMRLLETYRARYVDDSLSHVGGTAVIECVINEDGSVRRCRTIRASPGFAQAATRLALGLRYAPQMENGVAALGVCRFTIEFPPAD